MRNGFVNLERARMETVTALAAGLLLAGWIGLNAPSVRPADTAFGASAPPAPVAETKPTGRTPVTATLAEAAPVKVASAASRPLPDAPLPPAGRADDREAGTSTPGGAEDTRAAPVRAELTVPDPDEEGPSTAVVPFSSPATVLVPDEAAHLASYFDALGYGLNRVRRGERPVPRVFAAALPADLAEVEPTDVRKRLFLRLALPLVLKANEEVAAQRRRLLRIREDMARGRRVDAADRIWLADMAERYGVEDGDMEALLRRVDVVPVSLALAQSIQESGWGASRFARKGNALYGQRTWSENVPGLRPRRVEDPDFKVRAYDELGDSVRLYIHNLNTHPAYARFRERRAAMRAAGERPDGEQLAATLTRYSEERAAYVEKLRALMRANRLGTLDDAELADGRFVRRVVPHDEIDSVQLAYGSDT